MQVRKAFTLVELLVVIAIIALLISILAPSLGLAKKIAKNVLCMTNLNTLNKAFIMYASVNRDTLMSYEWNGVKAECPANTWKSYIAFTEKQGLAPDGYWKDRRLYGVLYCSGDIKPWQLLYCPGQENDTFVLANQYPEPWGTTSPLWAGGGPPSGSFIGVGYMYDPHVKVGATGWEYAYSRSFTKFPTDRWLTSDLLDMFSHMSHDYGGSNRWNIAYADGHVVSNGSMAAYNFLKTTTLSDYDIHEYWDNFILFGSYPVFIRNQ